MKKQLLALASLFLAVHLNGITQEQQVLIDHVKTSIERASKEKSKLSEEILKLEGMSSPKNRHLLNNLCTLKNTNYLEIGTWKGSTLVSALYKNDETLETATAIDNWSQFQGPRNKFFQNIKKFLNTNKIQVCEENSFAINKKETFKRPVNIYFYDGAHDFESQKLAFTYFNDVFADTFIAVVDDFNWSTDKNGPGCGVQDGTFAAIKELGYVILFEEILPSTFNGDISSWWNGLYVAVLAKK